MVSFLRGRRQVLVDTRAFGAGGAGHSHASALSLVCRDGAQEILIDPGTFTYSSDPALRDTFRGTAVHNTVRLGSLDQADPAGRVHADRGQAGHRHSARSERAN